jgi:peptidoglycan-N-acetylglucosamine deacetylase
MMHRYFVKTPGWVKKIFPRYIWDLPVREKTIFLSFDDGPHPEITPWVLEQLQPYSAAATFFCIGNNVQKFPCIYRDIQNAHHAVGNHTYHHLNGWKTNKQAYLADISEAATLISSNLFRPPYGRIKKNQAILVPQALQKVSGKIVMWDVLSGDFDTGLSPQQCLYNVLQHTVPGSIIVFHDSEKAFNNLKYVLPETLKNLSEQGYQFNRIQLS